MKLRTSELDGRTIVIEVESHDTGDYVDWLDSRGHGYAIFGEGVQIPMAVVDGRLLENNWFTKNHLLAVEAHELGHIRMNSDEEEIAELEGIRLLREKGHDVAADLLLARGIVNL